MAPTTEETADAHEAPTRCCRPDCCSRQRPREANPVVGLITKTETNPFFVKMKEGAAEAAKAKGAKLLSRRRQGRRRQRRPGDRDGEHDRRRREDDPDHAQRHARPSSRRSRRRATKGVMVIALDSPTDPADAHRRPVRHRQLQGRRADRPVRQGGAGWQAGQDRHARPVPGHPVGAQRHNGFLQGFGLQRLDAKSNELGKAGRGGVHGRQLRRPRQGPDGDGELPAEGARRQPRLHDQRARRGRRVQRAEEGRQGEGRRSSSRSTAAATASRNVGSRHHRRDLAAVPAEDGRDGRRRRRRIRQDRQEGQPATPTPASR